MTRKKPRREIFECPQCGADVPVGAKVCRECGSDARTGWLDSTEIDYASVDLPQGYADDPDHPGALPGPRRSWWVAAIAILAALALLALTVLR
ncbi:MAG TPA: zinc ribbon domain-containing protein [Planctomycetota bacterium]|nr:zinc ribbon domain-containing protein [Planctomycetota bacterium]